MSIDSNNPLVSVAVMTYNSSKYVLETLESVKAQTYPNIELIISDDASQDNTLEVVREWISRDENKQRFNSLELITTETNTGLPANCNRALKNAGAEWVKLLAGDDILLPNYIEDNMQFVIAHPKVKAVFSQLKVYEKTFEEKNFVRFTPAEFPYNIMHPEFTAEDQYELLLQSDRITYTPSFFLNKQIVSDVGGYDETNRLVEDYPMWLKLTQAGVKLHYFHKATVGYRMYPEAINNVGDQVLFKPSEINSFVIRKKYAHPHLPWMIVARETWTYRISSIFQALGWNKNTVFLRCCYDLWITYLNPFVYLNAISKRISKKK